MSDFDAVLERLLTEPSFASALAADPGRALAGYRLDAGETELLRSQVSADTGAGLAAVEKRTNKSSTFGLFSSAAEIGHVLSDAGFGGMAGLVGQQAAEAAGGGHGGTQGLGDAPTAWGSGAGGVQEPFVPTAQSGLGDAPGHALPPAGVTGLGDAPQSGLGGPEPYAPPSGYHPRIDADGDGHWDKATFVGTEDDGVEIRVDLNGDGRADFVGHDTDSDGRVDYADFDKDHDGVFEKRMDDDDGDGWLDRTVRPARKV